MVPPRRTGVFGGTFDPVHVGHLVAAVNVRHALALDRVLLVVASAPWQKEGRVGAAAEDRLAVVEAAVAGVEGLVASRIEIDRGGESVTADTLLQLEVDNPGDELFLIVGADVAADLPSWKRVPECQRLATLVVVDRPGAPRLELDPSWRVERVPVPRLEVSSSDVRARVAAGVPIDFLMPAAAVSCLRRLGLYAGNG